MVQFVKLLGQAGLNQQDILEAVIEKVNSNADRPSRPMNRNMILDLIATGLKFDSLSSDAFTEFVQPENLDKHLEGDSQGQIKLAL